MAKAYKCDICDKLYINPTEYEDRTDPVTGAACGFIPTGLEFNGDDGHNRGPDHDVCPECIKFFRRLIPTIREKGGTDWMVWPK